MTIYFDLMIGLTVGFGVGGSLGFWLVKGWKQNFYQREEIHLLAHLSSLQDTRQLLLDDVVENTNCANALVLKISNCGGLLAEGEHWFSSVVAESPERKKVSAIKDWQNRKVQEDYKALIRRVRSQGWDFIKTDEMPFGDLRRTYEAMGVVGSAVMFLFADDYFFYYMSFPVREHWLEFMDSPNQNKIRNTVLAMQRKYEKYSELGVLKYDNVN